MAQSSVGTCRSCGGRLTPGLRFCHACGAPVPVFCTNCGAVRTSQARFCPACGAAFGAGPMPTPTIPPAAPGARGRRPPTAYAALLLAAVVVLVAGALGTGIVKLPGAGTSEAPTESFGSPPPIDHLATPAQGVLAVGDTSPVAAIGLDGSGTSTTVSASGQDWDGLKVDVPPGAWPGATLQVSAEPITGSSFGQLVTPVSPLYMISGAEGMAPAPVTLKIPASIPNGSFAMGFFYDDASGHLEGMPLLAEDGTSVTIATEHFSSFFLSLVDRALLPETIDSGFRPGKDDWQFPNYGSYITPGGNCAGETLTEAWYYVERRLKGRGLPLYGLYDNNGYGATKTPDLWQDDSNGYRLASVAQGQYKNTRNAIKSFSFSLRGKGFDELQYEAFRYAMAVTGEPQLVSISDAQDNNGHEILAYRVSPIAIFVADPNYPGAWRGILYDNASEKFLSYLSPQSRDATTGDAGVLYTNFVYDAKTAIVDWSALTADWVLFDSGKIGVGLFPVYSLEALAGQDDQGNDIWVPLVNGYQTAEKQLTIRISDPSHVDFVGIAVFRGTASAPAAPANEVVTIDLKDGENPLGIYKQGWKAAVNAWKYVDFVRLTVIVGPAPTPSPTPTAAPTPTRTATPTPAATPAATFDCSKGRPSDLAGRLDWDLHCKAIQP